MNARITELVEYLRSSRARLGEAVAAVPAARHHERPAPERWSVNEIVEHLALVERGIARGFTKWLDEARAAGLGPEEEASPLLERMRLKHVVARSQRIEAPPRVTPTQDAPSATSLASIDASRGALIAAAEGAAGLALGSIVQPHPVLGPLTLYEWLGFAAAHMERHAAQVDDVAATLP